MAKLEIITLPDPLLRKASAPVERVDAELLKLADDMLETMYAAPGIGLAAPQVGVGKRVIVLDLAKDGEPPTPLKLANPEIVWASDEDAVFEEGCLSVPEHYAEVARPAAVRIRYLDYDDEIREMEASGLLATCLQHEMDHLDGILFIDHLTALKRNIILRKLLKAKKVAGKEAVTA
jgi:peptide deformylase